MAKIVDEEPNIVLCEPLTDEEMEEFRSLVWNGFAIGELTEAEAALMLLREQSLQ